MDHPANLDFLPEITGALDWWRDAGVDYHFLDEPREWLAPPEPPPGERPAPERRPARPPEQAPRAPRLDAASLPTDIAAFAQWWLTEPLLDEGGIAGRIAPQGAAGSKMMVIVEEPEAEDGEALLSGGQGRLLNAMLTAFGMTRDDVYIASAIPRHTPAPDWADLLQRGTGQVLAHHISLVSPERLFVLGGNILPLLGHELPQRPAVLREFNREGRSIPMLASWGLPALMKQPRAKPALWRTWLEWTAA